MKNETSYLLKTIMYLILWMNSVDGKTTCIELIARCKSFESELTKILRKANMNLSTSIRDRFGIKGIIFNDASEEEIEEMIEHIFDTINNVLVIRNIKMAREFKKWVEESTEIMEADKKVVAEIMDTPFFIDESKIKDYIHHPKENGYKALQFTLSITAYSTNIPGAQIEIQLKSQKMEEEAESGKASHEVYKKTGGHTTEELTDIDLLINEAFKITDFTQLHISGFYGNSEKEDRIGASQPDIFEIRHLSQSFVNKQ